MALALVGLMLLVVPFVLLDSSGSEEDADAASGTGDGPSGEGDHDHDGDVSGVDLTPVVPDSDADYVTNSDDPTGFNIELEFEGNWNAEEQQLVIRAAEYVSDIILSDQPDTTLSNGRTVDDLHVRLTQANLNGGTLGFESTYFTSDSTGLPVAAGVTMDTGLSESLFLSTILHELIHAVGFGETAFQGMVREINGTLRFTGTNAIAAYAQEFPATSGSDSDASLGVPVDALGHHWFPAGGLTHTLLAPDATSNQDLSLLTVAALEDLGLDTVWDDPARSNDLTGQLLQSILA